MDFLSSSIRLGQFAGINVRVHMLYLLWMGFMLFRSGGDGWSGTLLWMALLFIIVLLHEFGHCFGARAVGGDAREILMWPLGGLAFAEAPMRPWPQFVTIICGPLVNFAFCVIAMIVLCWANGRGPTFQASYWLPISPPTGAAAWQYYVWLFYAINQMLFIFNMLPIFPLDGGQLFRTLIWPFFGLRRATVIAAQVGLAGCALLLVWGVQSAQSGGTGMMIAIALFAGITCWQHLQAAQAGRLAEEIMSADSVIRDRRRERGFWGRIFNRQKRELASRRDRAGLATQNPNPGGWERKLEEVRSQEDEVDRILQKVHDHGVNSLTYVERQALERATRRRQEEEQRISRGDIG